jgi:3-hydroxyisobutyrate dehydrogenase-like beta-hydroxyacid dehydrogenase
MFRPTVAQFTEDDDADFVAAMQNGADLAHKDLLAALELGDELGVSLPLAAMTEARTDYIFGVGGNEEDR